jgi:glycosyltransferase involved in cell wall biosynthesis
MYVFSIITATFNRIENLKSLYKNLLNQKSAEYLFEWVVVVESEDFITINFLKKINKIKVVIVINKKKNFSNLIAQGVKNSSGKYICIIGDDDGFYEKKLEKLYDLIVKNNYPAWIVGDCNYVNNKNKVIRKFISSIKSLFLKFENIYLLKIVNFYMTPAIIIKRSFILKVNYFSSNFGNVNDYYTWIELREVTKPIITLDKVSFAGYDHGSISSGYNLSKFKKLFNIINNYNIFLYLPALVVLIFIITFNIIKKLFLDFIYIFNKIKIENKKVIKKKRILHLTRFFYDRPHGGIQEVIRQIAKNSKHTHIVSSISDKDKPLIKLSKNLYAIVFKKNFTFFGDIFSFNQLKFIISNHKDFQILHVHFPYYFSLIYLVLLKFEKKIIITYHANVGGFKRLFAEVFFKFFIKFVKTIYFYHFSSKKYLHISYIKNLKNVICQPFSINKTKIERLKNIKKYENIFNGEKYFIFIGRDTYYKNFNFLFYLVNNYKQINLLMITNKKVELRLKNLKVLNDVNDDEKFFLIKNSNGLVFPSNNQAESYGMVILEAMMMAIPSIIFDIGTGSSKLVKNNYNGIVVPNLDKQEYINSIFKLKNNEKLFKRLSSNCKIFYNKKFNKSGFTKLENAYSKI